MYNQLTKSKSLLCVLAIGFTIAISYAIHEKYYKNNDGLKRDK